MIEFKNLVYKIGGKYLLDHISGCIPEGSKCGIIGPNGAGKTTLLKALAGLLPLNSGEVFYATKKLSSLTLTELSTMRSYLPADPVCSWPLTVKQVINLGLPPNIEWTPAQKEEHFNKLIHILGLSGFSERRLNTLSSGEKNRVHLARCLFPRPQIFMGDEITSHLDPKHSTHFFSILSRKHAYLPNTSAFVLHDINLCLSFCDWILLIKDGKAVDQGPPSNILNAKTLEDLYEVSFLKLSHQNKNFFFPKI